MQKKILREVTLIASIIVSLLLTLSLISYNSSDPAWTQKTSQTEVQNLGGSLGAWFADISFFIIGNVAYLLPVLVLMFGINAHRQRDAGSQNKLKTGLRGLGVVLALFGLCSLLTLHGQQSAQTLQMSAGGLIGQLSANGLVALANAAGATMIAVLFFMAGLSLATGLSWLAMIDAVGQTVVNIAQRLRAAQAERRKARQSREQRAIKVTEERKKQQSKPAPVVTQLPKPVKKESVRVQQEKQLTLLAEPNLQGLPSLKLLDEPVASGREVSPEALQQVARQVELKLKDFGIEGQVVEVVPGPVITRFELLPAPGVKVAQISNLSKDLARSLSVISVRVVDVIPGKSVIGLEIPNENRDIVRLVELLRSAEYEQAASPLSLALGKTISGEPSVVDLAKMPHLLVAGTTGSGKSVAINAMILSLLYNATPEEVRLIMIDPKMLELSVYEGIPHLLTPVVTDMKDAHCALKWCVNEMERRYQIMASLGVRNIGGYNKKVKDARKHKQPLINPFSPEEAPEELQELPYIVVIVDELADMMMVVGKKVEELIARLAQKARAAGIHLILATQRPSVDVLTGLIKANIPSRVAFQVSSRVDSRTIIDQSGAESLLGHGDMLYLPPGSGLPQRVHGAFVADHEVHNVVADLQSRGKPNYDDSILQADLVDVLAAAGEDDPEQDPLYDQAVAIVLESRKASISSIQRRLKIGYNRAARMVEAMEAAGLISAAQSNGQREVLAPPQ